MDGWGSLTVLIKKQEAAKNRKAKLKYELQKRRESLISKNLNKLVFNEVSDSDLLEIKAQIRRKYRREKVKNTIVNIILLLISTVILYYIYIIIVK